VSLTGNASITICRSPSVSTTINGNHLWVQRLVDLERSSTSSRNITTLIIVNLQLKNASLYPAPRASKLSSQQPLNQLLFEVHLHQNVRKRSKMNPNPTWKAPKKMDSNRKTKTKKYHNARTKVAQLLFSSEEAQHRQQAKKASMAVSMRWWSQD